jgi:hypothetical protein
MSLLPVGGHELSLQIVFSAINPLVQDWTTKASGPGDVNPEFTVQAQQVQRLKSRSTWHRFGFHQAPKSDPADELKTG